MAPYLMDRLLERLRKDVAASLSVYQPSLSLTFAAIQLGFDTLDEVPHNLCPFCQACLHCVKEWDMILGC